MLGALAQETPEQGTTVGAIVDRLDERAFGLLVLMLTLPCLVPGLPGAQIIAIGIFLLAAQMLVGRSEPWLPGWFLRAKVSKPMMDGVAGFARKRLAWAEFAARPRLLVVTSGAGERLVAIVMMIAALTIMLPITNTIPSIALTAMAIGVIQRDGVFVLAGGALALAWFTALAAVVLGLVFGAGVIVPLVQEHAPWLAKLFGHTTPTLTP